MFSTSIDSQPPPPLRTPLPLSCCFARDLVTFVTVADIMRRQSGQVISSEVVGRKCTLIFFNITRDPGILTDDQDSSTRLMGVLRQLHDILADNGTLVIALKGLWTEKAHVTRERKMKAGVWARQQ